MSIIEQTHDQIIHPIQETSNMPQSTSKHDLQCFLPQPSHAMPKSPLNSPINQTHKPSTFTTNTHQHPKNTHNNNTNNTSQKTKHNPNQHTKHNTNTSITKQTTTKAPMHHHNWTDRPHTTECSITNINLNSLPTPTSKHIKHQLNQMFTHQQKSVFYIAEQARKNVKIW